MIKPDLTSGLMLYFIFLYSTVLHEAGHAWAALRLGDNTAYKGGQVSLDPIPHIKREPIGMLLVPIISFFLNMERGALWIMGWASAPYDPHWALQYPRRCAWMAMAGPAGNLLLVLVSAFFIRLGYQMEFFTSPDKISFGSIVAAAGENRLAEFFAMLLGMTFSLNLLLMLFNLLPVPPFDGSAIPIFFMSDRTAEKYLHTIWNPNFQIFGVIIAYNVFGYIFTPALIFAVNLLYPGVTYG